MAKQKTELKFSEDGKQCKIVFNDGSESKNYKTKIEVLDAIIDGYAKKKIPEQEGLNLGIELKSAPNLPFTDNADVIVVGVGNVSMTEMLMATYGTRPEKPTEIAYLGICGCGKHGTIYTKRGQTTPFGCKDEGFEFIKELKQFKEINEEEVIKLNKEIKESTLDDYY